MDTKLIMLGLVGFFINIFKDYLSQLWGFIVLKYSTSIYVQDGHTNYREFEEYIVSRFKGILLNHTMKVRGFDHDIGKRRLFRNINPGRYIAYVGKLTWVIISKYIENPHGVWISYVTNVTIFGFNKYKLYDDIQNIIDKEDRRFIYIENSTSGDRYIKRYKRKFESIFNKNIQTIKDHVDKWVSMREFYANSGFLYKTGILLYGKPGTGKSSLSMAVASYLDYDLHNISIPAYINERGEFDIDKFIDRIQKISQHSVILFEDIDTVVGSRDDETVDSSTKVSKDKVLGVILNVLDGAISPEGVIFIATTNHIEKLDPALIRPGRFDLKLEIGELEEEDIKNIEKYYNIDLSDVEDMSTSKLNLIVLDKMTKEGGK